MTQTPNLTPTQANNPNPWIVSLPFDLCFFVNIWWVAFVLIPEPSTRIDADSTVQFWQIYFITTPHRWLTLLLVATDPDRRQGKTYLFSGLAILAAIMVVIVWQINGLKCLIVVDYLWNAWHFGSQNAGILRIYSRKGGGGRARLESNIIRLFVMYVALRVGTQLNSFLETHSQIEQFTRWLDLVVLFVPLILVALEVLDSPHKRIGKLLYLVSVYSIYTCILLALRYRLTHLILPLTIASAAFHAIEYFAIVTFYAKRRQETGSDCLFRKMAKHWTQVLAFYIVLFGFISSYMEFGAAEILVPVLQCRLVELFQALNIWSAFLHYTYDGMIWKLRRPETAKAMNVELQSQGGSNAS